MKAKCDNCGEMVGVTDGVYDSHDYEGEECDGSGKTCKADDFLDLSDDETVARTFVIDFAEPLAKPKRTADGFLLVDAVVRSVGTFPYADGPEIATKDENAKAVDTFDRVPLYLGHPPGMVKPDNAVDERPIGAVTNPRVMDDGRIAASLCVWDGDAIGSIEQRKTTQLSSGYTCRVVDEDGKRYQRDVVANHVALLSLGRHGKAASLKLDRADAFSNIKKTDIQKSLDNRVSVLSSIHNGRRSGEIEMAHVLKFDGLSFDVGDANAQSHLDKFLARTAKEWEEKLGKEKSRADAADAAKSEAESKLTEKQKAFDVLEAKKDALEQAAKKDGAVEIEFGGQKITIADMGDAEKRAVFMNGAVNKAAAIRTALVVEASKHLSKNTKLDEMTDLDIKKAVVLALSKDAKLDGKSADYIQALYDDKIANAPKAVTAIDQARTLSQAVVVTDRSASDPVAARAASDERYSKANVKNAR